MGVSASQFKNARSVLPSHIRVIEISYNDAWMRDNGPIFVNNGQEVRAVDLASVVRLDDVRVAQRGDRCQCPAGRTL